MLIFFAGFWVSESKCCPNLGISGYLRNRTGKPRIDSNSVLKGYEETDISKKKFFVQNR